MGESIGKNIWLLVAFSLAILLAAGCSGDGDKTTRTGTTDFPDRTLAVSPETTASTAQTPSTPPAGTTGRGSEITLRLEGDAGTSFSGVCTTGAEDAVLVGQVPKIYSFDLRGQTLSCSITNQSPGNSSLRAVLLDGGNTRSIQQTKSQNSTINISYSGG